MIDSSVIAAISSLATAVGVALVSFLKDKSLAKINANKAVTLSEKDQLSKFSSDMWERIRTLEDKLEKNQVKYEQLLDKYDDMEKRAIYLEIENKQLNDKVRYLEEKLWEFKYKEDKAIDNLKGEIKKRTSPKEDSK